MNRYRKLHRFAAALVLVNFLAALTGMSALAGHACCGNCSESLSPNPAHAPAWMAADSCCPASNPIETTCACTFQSSDDPDRQVYSLTQVTTAGDDLLKGGTLAVSPKSIALNTRRAMLWTTRMEIRAQFGPIYLTNQSFLC